MAEPTTVREAVQSPIVRPTLDGFVDHFFVLAGGPEAVAAMLYDEYTAAKPGSLIRQRIMDSVLRSLGKADAGKDRQDMGTLTDEDLDLYLAEREAALARSVKGTNGEEASAAAPPGPVEAGAAPGGIPPAAPPDPAPAV